MAINLDDPDKVSRVGQTWKEDSIFKKEFAPNKFCPASMEISFAWFKEEPTKIRVYII